ncbi:MAG: sigma-70 family RNA polymerase sigma factor [Bacteroidetes bacterium]|nr:sigma-70 family RNA polymerase sigma factor [Bacteroidota bacterium]
MSQFVKQHPDAYLIQGLLDNDHRVIQTIYDRYADEVVRYVYKNQGSQEDAEDLLQEALIYMTRHARSGFVLTCPFGGFLNLVCKGMWINELKKRNRMRVTNEALGGSEFGDAREQAAATLRDILFDQMIERNFVHLPDGCQKILKHAWTGVPLQKVAEMLGLQYGYVRKRKSECSGELVELIQKDPEFDQLQNPDFDFWV